MANVMVTRQLSVYIKLIEATCLTSEAIRFFVRSTSNIVFFPGARDRRAESGEMVSGAFFFICQMVNK